MISGMINQRPPRLPSLATVSEGPCQAWELREGSWSPQKASERLWSLAGMACNDIWLSIFSLLSLPLSLSASLALSCLRGSVESVN